MTLENTQKLAEQIASILQNASASKESRSLESSIEELNRRLAAIESKLDSNEKQPATIPQSAHPSLEKFDVVEAVADQIIEHYQNEKACTFEPNGKPCDHCSMCSSRGF